MRSVPTFQIFEDFCVILKALTLTSTDMKSNEYPPKSLFVAASVHQKEICVSLSNHGAESPDAG